MTTHHDEEIEHYRARVEAIPTDEDPEGAPAVRVAAPIQRIPLTVVCTLNGAETTGQIVAVLVDDLDRLENDLARQRAEIVAQIKTRSAVIAERDAEIGRLNYWLYILDNLSSDDAESMHEAVVCALAGEDVPDER